LCIIGVQNGDLEKEMIEMSELRGVVYMIKKKGPRTEPCGMLQNRYEERATFTFNTERTRGQTRLETVNDSVSY